ncbi:MAG TPA: hypothetical protein VF072_03700, partial [Thermoleophilaceae bacterium]
GPRWGLTTHLSVRLNRNSLDAALADGTDPGDSPALSLRAAQLRSSGVRERLAAALAETVGDARTGQPANVEHPQRGEARACADQLTALAARLRSHQPVDVRGVAIVALLVNDRLHRTGRNQLRDAVADAHGALIPAHDAPREMSEAA